MESSKIVDFVDVIKAYWWLAITIIAMIAYVVKVAISIESHKKKIKDIETFQTYAKKDISYLLRCSFATLDGLKQLGCNGKTAEMYEEMRKYVLTEHKV